MQHKVFPFRLPTSMYEAFFRIFPGRGERTQYLQACVKIAIRLRGKKDCFEREVEEEIKKEFKRNG